MRQDKNKINRPATALVLCFCLMALVSIFAVKNSIDQVKSSMETSDVVKRQTVDKTDSTPDVVDSRDTTQSPPAGEELPDYSFPVEGKIITEHSMDALVYWKTLDQYMTHGGIDIAAEIDTPVQACAAGTVTKIDKGDSMGVTVEINHGDGLISVYSNLSNEDLIELGEVVTQGQVVGKVGNTSLFEFGGADHLHFEMIKNNKQVDPMDYLG